MALPIPLSALQRYVPALLLLLLITYGFPVNSKSLSLPLLNTLVQVTVGTGLPLAEQLKMIVPGTLSTATWSGLKPLKLGKTKKEEEHYLHGITDFKSTTQIRAFLKQHNSLHESTFRPHATSEPDHRDPVVLEQLTIAVLGPAPSTQMWIKTCGFKNVRISVDMAFVDASWNAKRFACR